VTGIDWRLDRKRARKLGAVLGVGLAHVALLAVLTRSQPLPPDPPLPDRKSTRLNSSHIL